MGPTGVGKTKLSIALAKKYEAYVINCDAVQIYKGLDIGSAKVTEEEKCGIKHFLFDIKSPNEEYSVKDYQEDLRNIFEKYSDKNLIIVGGSGLYAIAGAYDYRFNEEEKKDYSNYSLEDLYKLAKEKDINCNIDKNNRIRLERFLQKDLTSLVEPTLLYNDAIFIGLTTSRENLYNIINKRVDKMIDNGLVQEVKNLYQNYPESKILKRAIGYKEIIKYLNNEIPFEEGVELIKKNTRHYVKRQYTWFNNQLPVNWFNTNFEDFSQTENEVINFIQTKNKE